MSRRRSELLGALALLSMILGLVLSCQLLGMRPVLAQRAGEGGESISAANSSQKVTGLEQKVRALDQEVNLIKQAVSKGDVEILAAKKLHEISEKNLSAPNFMFTIVFTLLGVFIVAVAFAIGIIRKGILKEIRDTGTQYGETIAGLIKDLQNLQRQQYQLFSHSYGLAAVDSWSKCRLDEAIEFAQQCVISAEKAFGEKPQRSEDRYKVYRYRSNLAYMYAEKRRTDKSGEAIEYAKMGLEAGIATDELNLIDSYLYVLKELSQDPEDKKEWVRIYEIYKDRIYAAGIRKSEEQEDFDHYYKKTKGELFAPNVDAK